MEEVHAGAPCRYSLSDDQFRQFQKDHIKFEEKYVEKFSNGFICRILINYMNYAQDERGAEFETSVLNRFKNKRNIEVAYEDRITFTKVLTNKIQEFDFSQCDSFKKRAAVTYILDGFSKLPFYERELIYCYSEYKTIKEAAVKDEVLLIKISDGSEYEVKPYDIILDDNSFSYYLVGYSRITGSNDDFECHSIKLSRIKECRSKRKESALSSKERATVKDLISKFGSAYMVNNLTKKDIEISKVRLTEYGYKQLFLKIIAHQRPIPVSDPQLVTIDGTDYYELEFDCSHRQIRNYFFSFGGNVQVLFPESLKNKFIEDYKNALDKYNR